MPLTGKLRIIVAAMVILFFTVISASTVTAASRFNEIISRFYQSFKHVGDVEHEHNFSSVEGNAGFTAQGQGLVGGSHDAWSSRYSVGSKMGSSAAYTGYTKRDARQNDYVAIISGFSMRRGERSLVGLVANPNEIGTVSQDVSSKWETDRGEGFKHTSTAQMTDGKTKVSTSTDNSSTTIEVDGYSEYREIIVIERGGVKTGWWDMP